MQNKTLTIFLNCLDFLNNRKHELKGLPFNNYIQFHFDEKWVHESYIKNYKDIEPTEKQLIDFINKIISKNKKIIITTGKETNKLLDKLHKFRTNHWGSCFLNFH